MSAATQKAFVFLALLLGMAACSTAPVQETKLFSDAVTNVRTAGDIILDQATVAERRRRQEGAARGVFTVEGAYNYATIDDAGVIRPYRFALTVIGDYAKLLVTLAEGGNAAEAQTQYQILIGNLGALGITPQFTAIAGSLSGFIGRAQAQADIAEARRLLAEGTPVMVNLIAQLRAGTPEIFRILGASVITNPRPTADDYRRLDSYRETVANFVVLLDRLEDSFAILDAAYKSRSNAVSLAAVAKASADLNADVEAVRRALASAR